MSPAGGPPAAGGAGPFPRPPHHGAPVGFATIHGKDLVVGAVLAGIGLRVVAVPFDTDSLGTFSGEVERTASPIEVVRTKATAGAAAVGRLGLGSEGTFAPDPVLPLTLDTEIVGILDADSGVLVVGRATAPAPWAVTATFTDEPGDELDRLLGRAGFPDQRMMVTSSGVDGVSATKDLSDPDDVRRAVSERLRSGVRATVASDLRADRSPGRRRVVESAAVDLVTRLSAVCGACGSAGVGPEDVERGLRCEWCDAPTDQVAVRILRCPACSADRRVLVDHPADPAHCSNCNP